MAGIEPASDPIASRLRVAGRLCGTSATFGGPGSPRTFGAAVRLAMVAAAVSGIAVAAVVGAWPGAALAQSAQWGAQPTQTQPRRTPSSAAKQPSKQQAKAASPSAAAGGGELGQRVEQLEEQIVDLQVVIGTVESLAKSGGGRAGGGGYPASGALTGPDAGRIAALETQVQALTSQIEQMAAELRGLRAGRSSAGGAVPSAPSVPPPAGGWRPQVGGYNSAPSVGAQPGSQAVAAAQDPIGNLINDGGLRNAAPSPQAAKQAYERAYGHLLQQNYAEAETGFASFLQQFPNDEMAANAQFWLGETHFVRGQWDAAAAAFLKVAQSHGRSAKAPDSLAKLAMALERKGNRNAACRALAELNARYPNPPQYVKNWERAERRRAGCA